jgi:GT2 family glycosyltransferase
MSYDKITVVINTFKSEDKIHQCLNSIASKANILIVENSKNISLKNELEKRYENLKCILAGQNLGYAKGNNLGLSKVKTKYALVLNPDAVLEKDALERFLQTANRFPDFSIIGPAKQDEYKRGDLNQGQEEVFQAKSLKGFAMFLNMDQFSEIGFFDDNFFIYLEEIDLCKRLINKNKKIYLDKRVIIHHIGGSSHNKEINFEMELSRNWHWMWSTFYFNKKHYGYLFALLSVTKKFFSSIFKIVLYTLLFKRYKKKIYMQRFSGIFNSIIGNKSWYRPKIKNN